MDVLKNAKNYKEHGTKRYVTSWICEGSKPGFHNDSEEEINQDKV